MEERKRRGRYLQIFAPEEERIEEVAGRRDRRRDRERDEGREEGRKGEKDGEEDVGGRDRETERGRTCERGRE